MLQQYFALEPYFYSKESRDFCSLVVMSITPLIQPNKCVDSRKTKHLFYRTPYYTNGADFWKKDYGFLSIFQINNVNNLCANPINRITGTILQTLYQLEKFIS